MQRKMFAFIAMSFLVMGIGLLQAQTIEQQLDSVKGDVEKQSILINDLVSAKKDNADTERIMQALRTYYVREIKNGNLPFITRFYDKVAPISSYPYSFMRIAVEQKQRDIASFFIKKGVDIQKHFPSDPPLLYIAGGNRDASMIRLLLESKANPEEGYLKLGTPVLNTIFSLNDASTMADMEQCLEAVKVFIEFGANVKAMRPDDQSIALHRAVFSCYTPLIELLLKNGLSSYVNYMCDVENSESYYPPMYYAVTNVRNEEDRVNAVRLLFEYGADMNLTMRNGQPLIDSLMYPDSERIMDVLIEKGLDVNATDTYGRTLLWKAVASNQGNNVRVLLKQGADKTIKGKDYGSDAFLTPLEIGKKRKSANAVKLLK